MAANSSEADLKKLTVSQLRALCKEKKLQGYSKLPKNALIQKLVGQNVLSTDVSPTAVSSSHSSNDTSINRTSGDSVFKIPELPDKVLQNQVSSLSSSSAMTPVPAPSRPQTIANASTSTVEPVNKAANLTESIRSDIQVKKNQNQRISTPKAVTVESNSIDPPQTTQTIPSTDASDLVPSAKSNKNRNAASGVSAEGASSTTTNSSKKRKRKPSNAAESVAILDSPTNHDPLALGTQTLTPNIATSEHPAKKKKLKPLSKVVASSSAPIADIVSNSALSLLNNQIPQPFNPSKRPSTSLIDAPAKKAKSAVLPLTMVSKTGLPKVTIKPVAQVERSPFTQESTKLVNPPRKRFIPLIVNPKPRTSVSDASAVITNSSPPHDVPFYLDFPASAEFQKQLTSTSFPPSIAQRKRVPRLALLLSFAIDYLDDQDLRRCVLVSRMFRYAVYLSSYQYLCRHFKGLRLSQVLSRYPDAARTINMWPYLSERLTEVHTRRRLFEQCFLGRLFPSNIVSQHLWTSPDHERQLVVALRFILTRHFFKVSVGDNQATGGLGWREGQIVDAQPVVSDEVWKITIRHTGKETESFYVLEQTCEPLTAAEDSSGMSGIPVRIDWAAYISQTAQEKGSATDLLLQRLSWTNHEEYDHGISRIWLKRMEEGGEMGCIKRSTAERYVLACVVGNSLSGRWMSSNQMDQEFQGLPEVHASRTSAKPRVNLYLPPHHNVESLHFTASGRRKGQPLHGALAVVQTPGREYYILRDNGMQVGTEEEGVGQVWMKLLQCDNWGVACE